ncbi:MAG: monovalent cation/H+ antiporter subunit D family protein [Verrucomicrobiae bacterium]|nr:monovalent cation/H+ antiporter subunit D family protein [Verrucomicrobiae bacterium]MCP5539210.1 monovalent cation/H+ antiporter subunit D family protein [Akkermansiaceae bacterium]MCP5549863.1 monovalent cation/H+ antiporter subunit D family protein [Akkermansiaceae bacterium]
MDDSVHSLLPVWACLASLLAVPAIVLFRREPVLREGATFAAGIAKLAFVLAMLPVVLSGKTVECTLVEGIGGFAAPIRFRVDALGLLFALVASGLWIVTSLYAVGYMRGLREHSQTRFFAFFAVSLSATLGVAFAGNLLTLYLFYEMLSLATWPLVAHHQDKEARTGGRTYLTYLLGTSIGFALPALVFTWQKTGGHVEFDSARAILAETNLGYWPALLLLLLFVFGFSKAGLMPFHSWLPGAMVAPTPVSALLHAVAVVKVGVFCVLRVVSGVFGVEILRAHDLGTVLGWIAAVTVLVSSLIALSQDNLKRRLAFSTIGQLAYIVLGAALLSERALTGSALHIAAHAAGKITLFFCAGAIFVATGKKYISEMAGLGRAMPVTFAAFFIGSLGVIGLPPSLGLISKLHLVLGAADANRAGLLVVYLVSTLLNAAYFLPIVYQAFFPRGAAAADTPKFSWRGVREAPWACVVPLSVTALLSMGLFFAPGVFLKLAQAFAAGVTP